MVMVTAWAINPTVVMVPDGRYGCLIARNLDGRTGYVRFKIDQPLEPFALVSLGYTVSTGTAQLRRARDKS